MKSSYLRNVIGGGALAFSLLLGIGMSSSVMAQQDRDYDQYRRDRNYNQNRDRDNDQYRRDRDWRRGRGYGDGYPNLGGSFDFRQTALNAGYNEGIKQGRSDRDHRRRYDFRGQSAYQKATHDYDSRKGADRELYRTYYRMAYERGYEAGWNGY